MTQLKRLSLVVTACFLGTVGVAQVTPSGNATSSAMPHGNAPSSAKPHGKATSIKLVVLNCQGDSGSFTVHPDIVIFATPPICPLQSFQFDENTTGFTFKGTDSDGNYVYAYDGTPVPSTGYRFSYITTAPKPTGGNGTGVIK